MLPPLPVLHVKLQAKAPKFRQRNVMLILLALPTFLSIFAFQNFSYSSYNSPSVPILAQDRFIIDIPNISSSQTLPTFELSPAKRLFFNDSNSIELHWQMRPNSIQPKTIQLFIENIGTKAIYPIIVSLQGSPMILKPIDIKNHLNVIQHLNKDPSISLEPKDYRLKMLMLDSPNYQFIRLQRTLHL